MWIKIVMLILFFSCMIGIGIYCKKSATDVNGFVLGGRSVGPWLTAFAYGTSYFSAVVFVGYAGQFGWKYGIAATWAGIGNAILGSLLAWVVLGRRTRIMTQHLDSATMPQFFESRFDSKGLKLASSALIFLFMIPYTASLYNGLSRLFEMAFHVPYELCVIVMATLTAVYVIVGGYMATAINDFIQGIIMLFGIVAVLVAILNVHGGLSAALASLGQVSDPAVSQAPGVFASFFGPDPVGLLGVVILTSLGTWGLPQMVQKFYAIKNEKQIGKGTVISTLFALVVAGGCYFLGGFGRLYTEKLDVVNGAPSGGFDSVVPTMLEDLSPFLMAVVIILVLSASMSTLSSLVMTSSSTLTLDFIRGLKKKEMNEKTKMILLRLLIALFILISAAIAIFQTKAGGESVKYIAQLMGISWGAMAGAFLAPFLYGLYSKKVTKAAVWVNMIFSALVMVGCITPGISSLYPAILKSPINAGAFCMLFGLILVPAVSAFTKKSDPQHIEKVFSCYERTVTVPVTDSIGVSGKEGDTK